jgi:hypothetical protein
MTGEREASELDDRGPMFATYEWIASEVLDGARDLYELQTEFVDASSALTHAMISVLDLTEPSNRARSRVVSQALNDYMDLLYETISGRGRPAIRSARTLFEHLVNYRTVDREPDAAIRYCEHEPIGELLDLRINTPRETDFKGSARRGFRHWLTKETRRIQPAAERAVATYGPGFRSSWAGETVFDRSKRFGLEQEYDFYRLCSAIIHGSASGTLGAWITIDDSRVVRTGPAISLCPMALERGNRYFADLLHDVEAVARPGATQPLLALTKRVESSLELHRAAALGVDKHLWPSEVPMPMTFLKVDPRGRREWVVLDGERNMTISVDPVDLDLQEATWLEEEIAAMERANPGRTKTCIIAVPSVRGIPRSGARWMPAAQTLRQRPLTFGTPPMFQVLPVEEPGYDPSLYE